MANPTQNPQKPAEPDIIPIDIPDGPGDRQEYIDLTAVFADETEAKLIGQLWDLSQDNVYRFVSVRRSPSPFYVEDRMRGAVKTLKAIASLLFALDEHRHGLMTEMLRYYGPGMLPKFESKKGMSLSESNVFLAKDCILRVTGLLDRVATQCRGRAIVLERTEEYLLRGVSHGRRFGPDRRGWEERFFRLATFCVDHANKFQIAMKVRQANLAFQAQPAKRQKPLTESLAAAASQFSIAKNVKKAALH